MIVPSTVHRSLCLDGKSVSSVEDQEENNQKGHVDQVFLVALVNCSNAQSTIADTRA
jgi:hypothetical protein